ncbi:unnamed protein product, partial [Polarella glacialis]
MTPELLKRWQVRIREKLESMDLPPKLDGNLRGVYIGISAVYYAADLAGCSEVLLPKAVFVERLGAKLADLLANPPAPKKCKPGQDQVFDHREFANLVLVREVVSRVMADTAWIVCKRNWRAAPVTVSEGQ